MSSEYRRGSSSTAPPGHEPVHRVPTDSSYYSFNGTPYNDKIADSQTWMYAREARAQQAGLVSYQQPHNVRYPSRFGNGEKLPFTTPGSYVTPRDQRNGIRAYLHHPLIPGRSETWAGEQRPGAVRSAYTKGDPNRFDVMYHDPKKGASKSGHGSMEMANYHAAVPPRPPRAPTA
ncbi:hypothetical protein F4821DRAFT_166502 [Hypoxylon rubiginosum]|uniref:Uncharacterized protein n=1 Tax=Hypoxylon rubiginosum TaxID=110542 RepID=A0ACC0CW72_9PEZI|nr:hypothetical protein F4821DRAFT_166502 [Hypoxylon rubiginosum]